MIKRFRNDWKTDLVRLINSRLFTKIDRKFQSFLFLDSVLSSHNNWINFTNIQVFMIKNWNWKKSRIRIPILSSKPSCSRHPCNSLPKPLIPFNFMILLEFPNEQFYVCILSFVLPLVQSSPTPPTSSTKTQHFHKKCKMFRKLKISKKYLFLISIGFWLTPTAQFLITDSHFPISFFFYSDLCTFSGITSTKIVIEKWKK